MNGLDVFGVTFAFPWALALLLLIPLLAWLKGKFGGTPGVVFSSTQTLRSIGVRRRSRAGDLLTALSLAAFAAFVIALARPQLGKTITRTQASGIDIMLCIDVSRSMLSEDFSIGAQRANRIEAVKRVAQQFIEQRPNDRIGIIAFAGRPYLVSPLTLDHDWLIQNMDRVQIGLVEDGTAIGSALATAENRLKDKEAKTKLIVLLTDGDNNAGKVMPLTAAEAAKALGIRIYTIGAGTRGMAPYPFTDPFGRTVYQNVPVQIDEDTLKKIAALSNGEFFRATDTRSLREIFSQIDKLEKSKIEVERIAQYRDFFPWFLIGGVTLLVAEIAASQTIWRRLP
ncbi:MAG: VWA domain-containing protein [Terrimicrobiaceae bacterium]|nr:VWA domain-containing protein [Terrimicrobiaceae bacterium]